MSLTREEANKCKELKELKATLEDTFKTAKESGDIENMFLAVKELCDNGLISKKDKRLQGKMRQAFIEQFGNECLEDLEVNEYSRNEYEALCKNMGKSSSGGSKKSADTYSDWSTRYAEQRRQMNLMKPLDTFEATSFKHLGNFDEYGRDNTHVIGQVTYKILAHQITLPNMVKKIAAEEGELVHYIQNFIEPNDEYMKKWEAGEYDLVELRVESPSLMRHIGVAKIDRKETPNGMLATARVAFNIEVLNKNYIDIEVLREGTYKALKRMISTYKGDQINVDVKFKSDVEQAIKAQVALKNQAAQSIVQYKIDAKQAELDAEAAKEEKKRLREERAKAEEEKKAEREARRAAREAAKAAKASAGSGQYVEADDEDFDIDDIEGYEDSEEDAEASMQALIEAKKAELGRDLTKEEILALFDPNLVAQIKAEMATAQA